MKKINVNSWHYKWLTTILPTHIERPKTICGYVWSFVFYTILMFAFVSMVIWLAILLIGGIPYVVYCLFVGVPEIAGYMGSMFVCGCISWLIIFGTCVVLSVREIIECSHQKALNRNKVEKVGMSFSAVLTERFESFKEKRCALIEYVDDEE